MTLAVRIATLADLDVLLTLDRASFSRAWTPEQWRSELRPLAGLQPLVVLGILDGRPVGHACAPIQAKADLCELRRIGVVPDARARGVAGDLIDCVIDHAKRADCTRIELEVAADNLAAIALYRRRGFCQVGVRPRYYIDPPADALMMDLELAGGMDGGRQIA